MQRKRLIINADDLGIHEAVDDAIRTAYTRGRITGTSIMPCGASFDGACSVLDEMGKKEVGVHLTITDSLIPCTQDKGQIQTLLSEEGTFAKGYCDLVQALLKRKMNPDEIFFEFAEQINKVKSRGYKITHLDSHQHIHMLPGILKIVIRLANTFDIPYIRLSHEPGYVVKEQFEAKDLARHLALKAFCLGRKKKIRTENVKCNDSFLGHFHAGRMNKEILEHLLKNLPEGLTELAVHIATDDPNLIQANPWYKNGKTELDILLSDDLKCLLEGEDISLVTHKEICG